MMKRFFAVYFIFILAADVFAEWTQTDYDAYNNAVEAVRNSYGSTDSASQLSVRSDLWNISDNAAYVSHTWQSGEKAGQTENLVKVVTWAWNYSSWTQNRGTEWALSENSVFPWVTLGGSESGTLGEMQSYFRTNYSMLSTDESVYDKVWHTLGMSEATKDGYTRVLVEFLVSADDLIRPSYFQDTTTTPDESNFLKNPDGSYVSQSISGLPHELIAESNIDWSIHTLGNDIGLSLSMQNYLDSNMNPVDAVIFPFTGMGYTYNSDPDALSYIGLSEFIVNGNAVIVNWDIIGDESGELYSYLIPEASQSGLYAAMATLVFIFVAKRRTQNFANK